MDKDKKLEEFHKANKQWALRYKELEQEFAVYRASALEAQKDATDHIFILKEKVEKLKGDNERMKSQLSSKGKNDNGHCSKYADSDKIGRKMEDLRDFLREMQSENKILRDSEMKLKEECRHWKIQARKAAPGSEEALKELEGKNLYLNQCLENYKDDLRAERKDKEEARRKLAEVQLELETERTRLSVENDDLKREVVRLKKEGESLRAQLNLKTAREKEMMGSYLSQNGNVVTPRGLGGKKTISAPGSPRLIQLNDARMDVQSDSLPPPYKGTGSHKCSRCYRRFTTKKDLNDHSVRCVI